jgi:peroxiredoxin
MKQTTFALVLLLTRLLSHGGVDAREITLHFPHFAGQSYDWNIFQGEKTVTLASGVISPEGRVTLVMPDEYKIYRGMTRWMLKTGGGLDMIYAGKGFSVECLSDKPSNETIVYTGDPENIFLRNQFKRQQAVLERLEAVNHLLQVYTPQEELYPILSTEQGSLRRQFGEIQADRKKSPLYAARFGEVVDFTRGIADRIYEKQEDHTAYFNDFMTLFLNFQDLYTSGHWDQVLHTWLMMNIRSGQDAAFGNRLGEVLKRMDQDDILAAFVRKTVPLLVQMGKDDLLPRVGEVLDKHPGVKTGLTEPARNMLASYKILTGRKAPDLVFQAPVRTSTGVVNGGITIATDKLGAEQTLLLFYQGDCQPCEDALIALSNGYNVLKDKNVRVIAVSADESPQSFEKKIPYHQWPDNYCDFTGKAGVNFKNYAVLGTPTMFLLDRDGIVVKKTAVAEDLLLYFRSKD